MADFWKIPNFFLISNGFQLSFVFIFVKYLRIELWAGRALQQVAPTNSGVCAVISVSNFYMEDADPVMLALKLVGPNEVRNWSEVVVDLENLLLVNKITGEVLGYLDVPQYSEYHRELAKKCLKEAYAWGVRFC